MTLQQHQILSKVSKDLVPALRKEAEGNKVFNAICLLFALRQRTRNQVTMASLRLLLAKEKFTFSRKETENCLIFLASLGIGRLVRTKDGQVEMLKDIQLTLQSIGQVALGKRDTMESFRPTPVYADIQAPVEAAKPAPGIKPPPVSEAIAAAVKTAKYELSILAQMDGKQVSFKIPKGYTPEELGLLVLELNEKAQGAS